MHGMFEGATSASKRIPVNASTTAETVVSCAERTVTELAGKDDRWDARVTRRDPGTGLLETGNYHDENESGFRVRLQLDANGNAVDIGLKGAGAYNVDLGVDDALDTFTASLEQCVSMGSG